MVAASFITLIYWLGFLAVAVYLACLVQQRADRRNRIRRLRERRRHMDSLEPKRWTQ